MKHHDSGEKEELKGNCWNPKKLNLQPDQSLHLDPVGREGGEEKVLTWHELLKKTWWTTDLNLKVLLAGLRKPL